MSKLMNFSSCLLLAFLLLAGCGGSPIEPLSLEEAPAALRKAFASAQTFTKQTAETIAKQIGAAEFGPASIQLQALLDNTSLNKEQRSVASRVRVAVALKLEELAASATPAAETPAAGSAPTTPAAQEKAAEAAAIRDHYIRTK